MLVGMSSSDNKKAIQNQELAILSTEQATKLAIGGAKKLVDLLIAQRGHEKPPFSPEEFAGLQGISKIVGADLGKTSAVLIRIRDGYLIKVNQNHHLVRRNFSCAHEIGHIMLKELKLEHYIQNIEYRTFNPEGEKKAHARIRERLCDVIATELLMPERIFRDQASVMAFSIDVIERLARIFQVSVQAAAIRIAEVSAEPCVALLWQVRPRTKTKSLKLVWSAGPGVRTVNKFQYTLVNPNAQYTSAVQRAYESAEVTECYRLFRCGVQTYRLRMESKGFGYDENRFVMSLAFAQV
jgi:Zn-dependent peptidase ImmA (M78 family)